MSITYAGQRFLILGAGVTGSAVAASLKSRGGLVTIADDNSNDAVKPESVDLSNFDAVVISFIYLNYQTAKNCLDLVEILILRSLR